jgi:hypothetical protein
MPVPRYLVKALQKRMSCPVLTGGRRLSPGTPAGGLAYPGVAGTGRDPLIARRLAYRVVAACCSIFTFSLVSRVLFTIRDRR